MSSDGIDEEPDAKRKPVAKSAIATKKPAAKGKAKKEEILSSDDEDEAPVAKRKPVAMSAAANKKQVPVRATGKSARAAESDAMDVDEDSDDGDFVDAAMNVENNTGNVAPMDVDPKPAPTGKKMTLVVTGGPHGSESLKMFLSAEQKCLVIGNGKSKEPSLALTKEKGLLDVHCKLTFGLTKSKTPRVDLVAMATGVLIGSTPAPVGKAMPILRGGRVTIGLTVIDVY